jgi:hypothetical protein
MRPGRIARDYADGKRARYSAPVRIYLIMTLILFGLSAAVGIRPLAITLTPDAATIRSQSPESIAERRERLRTIEENYLDRNDEPVRACGVTPGPDEVAPDGSLVFARDTSINIALFQRGEPPEERGLDAESAACFSQALDALGTSWVERVVFEAIQHPGTYEARAAAIASQAFLFMVAGFALLNLALHPRRRMIEHIVYSLYWHTGLVPAIILIILVANLGGGGPPALIVAGAVVIAVPVFATLQERGFYGSTWIGTAVRMPVLVIGYAVMLAGVGVSLILLGAR